jgi:hypothetical protein
MLLTLVLMKMSMKSDILKSQRRVQSSLYIHCTMAIWNTDSMTSQKRRKGELGNLRKGEKKREATTCTLERHNYIVVNTHAAQIVVLMAYYALRTVLIAYYAIRTVLIAYYAIAQF